MRIAQAAREPLVVSLNSVLAAEGWGQHPRMFMISRFDGKTLGVLDIDLAPPLWDKRFGYTLLRAFASEYRAGGNGLADKLFQRLKPDKFAGLVFTCETVSAEDRMRRAFVVLDVDGVVDVHVAELGRVSLWPQGWGDNTLPSVTRIMRDVILGLASRHKDLRVNTGMLESLFPGAGGDEDCLSSEAREFLRDAAKALCPKGVK